MKGLLLWLHFQHPCLQVTAAMEEMFTVFGSQQPATPEQMAAKDTVFGYLERALKMVRCGWLRLACRRCHIPAASSALQLWQLISQNNQGTSGHCEFDLKSSPAAGALRPWKFWLDQPGALPGRSGGAEAG